MMRTTEPNVYAIGDITPHPWLAHCASAQGIVAVEHIAGKNPRPLNYDRIPNATYCYPEVASVGLTEKKAKETRLRRQGRHLPLQRHHQGVDLRRGHRAW